MIVEDVDYEVRFPKGFERAMNGEVGQYEHGDEGESKRHLSYYTLQLLHLVVLPCYEGKRQDASEVEEHEVELGPEEEAEAYAHDDGLQGGRRLPVPREAQHVVEAMSQDGQGELFHAVAIGEEVGGIGYDAEKKELDPFQTSPRGGFLPRKLSPSGEMEGGRGVEEPHRLPRIEQIEVAADYLDEVDAYEAVAREEGCRFVHEE